MEALQKYKRYTYADYLTWPDDVRYELIDGVPYMMAPPSIKHQDVSGELFFQLRSFLNGKPCEVYYAPFAVQLDATRKDGSTLEPDIVVICDKSKLNDKGCVGAPDMVIEILSPSTSGYDKVTKFDKYMWAGVREYWIVEPNDKTVAVHTLKDGEYASKYYTENDVAPVSVLEGCRINLKDIFE